jgi:L(+)-tartrate dehydratase beta subunit
MATTLKTVNLQLPAQTEDLAKLELGNVVYLTGRIYTAREGVYKRAVEDGMGLPAAPEDLGFANFHCSPAATLNADGRAAARRLPWMPRFRAPSTRA